MGELEEKLNKILSSPADMKRIMELARNLGGQDSPAEPSVPDIDGEFLKKASRIMKSCGTSNDKQALLLAMRPYLRYEHRDAIDAALRALKLAHIAKVAMEDAKGGGDDNTLSR